MKILVGINQAEALRRGIDAPSSTALVNVDPASLSDVDRTLVADRLSKGNRLCRLVVCTCVEAHVRAGNRIGNVYLDTVDELIAVVSPSINEVLEACRENQSEVDREANEIVERDGRMVLTAIHREPVAGLERQRQRQ